MSIENTQRQSEGEEEQARALSLARTRPPREVPGYELNRFVGAGAYGEVWEGVDENTGRRVAVKFYARRSHVDWSLIYREVEKLVFLSTDRHIVQLLDVAWDSDPPYYVMEFIEGGSLAELLEQRGPLEVDDAEALVREIATGLLHAHGRGVLHCDLKPENVLLDHEQRPRLADFGQARLTDEQAPPALGTLFYMAPEQADLQAVPDARWDVYALGAIFYCLLTGAPPCRDSDLVRQLETAKDLAERLSRYRRRLLEGPPPEAHRQVKRIDRSLIQILDKCLAVKPDERFANVQELLDALDARSAARARRPLVTLGFVGPLLLLLVMALFGWRGYHRALIETEELAQGRAIESNRFAAQLAAEKVASEIASYFDIVRGEAERGELFEQFLPLLENPWLRRLSDPQMMDDQVEEVRRSFVEDEQRFALTHYLEARLRVFLDAPPTARATPKFVSMFVLDSHGTMLAAAYDEDIVSNSVGRNWGHRSYFHGGPDELTPVMRPPIDAKPIEHTHLSPVFKSTTTGRLKVAVSTPIYHEVDDKQVCIGVLVMTINHGDFEFFRSSSARTPDRFAVLVDGRPGPERGTILVHPLLTDLLSSSGQVPDELRHSRVPPEVLDEELSKDTTRPYVDPLSQDPRGADYARRWIAAATPVELLTGENGSLQTSGLIVLVQEDFQAVIEPVYALGNQLLREGISALTVVIAVVVALWYFVSRFLV